MELFFDLAFVVAIATTAHSLSSSGTAGGYLEFAVLFVLLQWAWTGYTFYNDRFDSDDLLHRIAGLCQMFLVLFIATLHHWLVDDFRPFVLAYVLLRLFTIGFNYYAGIRIPVARQTTRTLAIGYSIALVPLLAALFVSSPTWRLVLVASCALLQLVPPLLLTPSSSKDLPLSVSHIPERLGLFLTLTLGECFAGIVRMGSSEHRTPSFGLGSAIAIVIVFCFWWTYFSGLRGNVLRDMGARTKIWVYGHVPLTMCVVALAVGLEDQLEPLLKPDEQDRGTLLYLAWGTGLICLALIQSVSHAEDGSRFHRWVIAAMLIFGSMCLAYAFGSWDGAPLMNLSAILAMGVSLVLLCIYRDFRTNSNETAQPSTNE